MRINRTIGISPKKTILVRIKPSKKKSHNNAMMIVNPSTSSTVS